ncbi:MAG: thioredoxin family protein [Crocinitomicaceae bacterium]|nr:thioredoxin family protein [Crocinitomicaceae bacterium]
MALVESTHFELGTTAPDFNLLNTVNNQTVSLNELKGEKGTAIFFICNHCPFVIHIMDELIQLGKDYADSGVNLIAISSNNVQTHPQDGPEYMKSVGEKFGYPYLYDETQDVAHAYKAACTPDLYVFDGDLKLTYHGQLDDSRPGNNVPVTGKDIRNAIDCLIEGTTNEEMQKPSIGCSIKWK